MSDIWKGRLFVTVQFGLFAAIIFTPAGADWDFPTQLSVISWVAFALTVVALWQLGKARTATPVPKMDGELITTGLYKSVRHPIYGLLIVGFGLMAVGTENWQAVRFWVALIFLFYFKSNFEEKLLLKKYPDYAAYQTATGRFFPKINF